MCKRLVLAVLLVLPAKGTVSGGAAAPPGGGPASRSARCKLGAEHRVALPVHGPDYLLWWIKDGPLNSPLSPFSTTNAQAGPLGTPGAQSLYPGNQFNYGVFSGLRLSFFAPVNDVFGFEKSLFFLEQRSVGFAAAGGPDGTLFPGATGATSVTSHTRLSGWEINAALNTRQQQGLGLTLLGGMREIDLNEDVQIRDEYTLLAPVPAGFQGMPLPAGAVVTASDRFRATNHFYGGQLGGRAELRFGVVSLGSQSKLALGTTQQLLTVVGSSSAAGLPAAPGGVFAQTSNIGRRYRSVFGIVPEEQVFVAVQPADWVRLTLGYTFLYWSDVARPGQQIDRVVNPALVPTNPAFGAGSTLQHPGQEFNSSAFWAQGLSVGIEFRF